MGTKCLDRNTSTDPERTGELIPILRRLAFNEAGTSGYVSQGSIFGRGYGGARIIDLEVTGPDFDEILDVARDAIRLVREEMPAAFGIRVSTRPGLELGAPEVRVIPDLQRLADNGLTARDLGLTIDAFNDGLRVAQIVLDGRRTDLTIMGPEGRIDRTQGIGNLPIVTAFGNILPISALATIEVTAGPTQILHLERNRTVSLRIRPGADVALETTIQSVRDNVIGPLTERGLPPGVRLSISGTADELARTWDAMKLNLLIAVIVVYLVMAVLFESFVYPLVILFSVPLATAGGVGGLVILNLFVFHPLDMLTLLGFVILIGTVVNNAILLVHQTLLHVREDAMPAADAIVEATRNRVRPIFMSTLTSVCGMLPLVLFSGAGSEIYRGLGSVVVGGLALSAVLTLLIIPPLLGLITRVVEKPNPVPASESSGMAKPIPRR